MSGLTVMERGLSIALEILQEVCKDLLNECMNECRMCGGEEMESFLFKFRLHQ